MGQPSMIIDWNSGYSIKQDKSMSHGRTLPNLWEISPKTIVSGDQKTSAKWGRHLFPECVARVPVSLWGSGGWGCVRSTLRSRAQPPATVRTNSVWPCLWEVLQRWSFLEVSDVWLLRFAWQAWHFVTFRRVLQRVESRFAWQAQYFCDVFRRCVAVFVAGAALWACPSSFFVAGAAL